MKSEPWSLSDCLWCLHRSEEPWHSGRWLPTPLGCPYGLQILCTWKFICHQIHIYLSSTFHRSYNEIKTQLNAYALSDKRCSQQLHAIANPSEEEVALPSSSMTIKLLHFQKSQDMKPSGRFICVNAFTNTTCWRHSALWKRSLSSLS